MFVLLLIYLLSSAFHEHDVARLLLLFMLACAAWSSFALSNIILYC
jgi:uncharacterized membrane protein